jgi:hypothetical protein
MEGAAKRIRRPRPVGREVASFASPDPAIDLSVDFDPTDPYWREVYEGMLRESLVLFAKDVLGLQIGPHMIAWDEMISTHRRVAVNAARDHSKSTFFSYAYPIWRAWSEPGVEVYLFSKTLEQAMEFIDIIVYGRDNLKGMLGVESLAKLVPTPDETRKNPLVRLNRADLKLHNGSRIRAVGYGKAIRGRHPKYIVLDDPLNDEDMWSEGIRRKNIEYFKSAIVNMATPTGQVCVVGTPYHASDLYGWLRKNPVYAFRRFPGLFKDRHTNEERALFPWRWSVEQLQGKRREIGPIAFAREILCEPVSDDMSVFPSYLFPPLRDNTLRLRPTRAEIEARGWNTYMGVDIARSANVGADYFVIFVLAKDRQGQQFVVDIIRSRGLTFRKQLESIVLAAQRYDPGLIYIESNAMQQIYTDEMRRATDLPVKEFVTLATNKYPLDRGVPGLRIVLENEKLTIPYADDPYTRNTIDTWIGEATQFGFVDGRLQGIGEHDDTVMAWWFANEAARSGGFSFAFGDESGERTDDEDTSGGESWEDVLLGREDGSGDGASASGVEPSDDSLTPF